MIFRCRIGSRWRFEFVSQSCFDLTGCSQEQLLKEREDGVDLLWLIDPADRENFRTTALAAVANGESFEATLRFRGNGDALRWVWLRGVGTPGEAAGDGWLEGFITDITPRVLNEERLRKEGEHFRTLVESLPQVIFETDRNGVLTFGNPLGFRLFGYSPEDINSRLNVLTMIASEDLERARLNVGNVMSGRSFEGHEYTALRKDGSRFPIMIYSTAIRNEQGEPQGMRGIIVDITDFKESQRRQRLTLDVLETLNSNLSSQEMISRILQLIRRFTGIEAIAIRLIEDSDYPFFEAEGFPADFMEAEKSLLADSNSDSGLAQNRHDCVCGAVVDGRVDLSLRCFTEGGSFWVDSSASLIGQKPALKRNNHLRGLCLELGFESLALIPVRAEYEMIGLIQLADHRPGVLNQDLIQFFEDLASSIGIAISRKLADDRLRESETRYREMVENITEAIFAVDNKGVITYISPAVKAVVDFDPSEMVGHSYERFIHPDDLERMRRRIEEIYQEGTGTGQWRVLTRQGETRWVRMSSRPIIKDGKPVGLRGVMTDITAHKQFEDELSLKNCAIDSALTGIVMADLNGVVTYVNDAFARMWGFESAQQVEGHRYCEFLVEGLDESLLIQEFEKNRVWRCELNGRRLDGSLITVLVQSSVVNDAEGQPLGYVASCTDTTELRQLEQERGKAAKLESVGLLAGGIAHDFNNILTAVLGNISLAKVMLERDHRANAILTEAEKASLIAKNLTQQLLTFSKGGMPVKTVLSLEALIREAVTFSLHGSNVNCRFEIQPDLWNAEVDEGQIGQVLNNLVINADQAMPDGGSLVVRAANRTLSEKDRGGLRPGDYLCITVEDMGSGIAPENLSRIFDPYFTTKPKGSGLGLATSYAIIHKHGGDIQVESEPGKGSRFHVFLPALRDASVAILRGEWDKVEPGKGRVLLMDDEAVVRDVAKAMLEHIGYRVSLTADGFEAVETYRSEMEDGRKFDLVILDLTVPGGMGGKETIRHLLEIDPQVRAVVSSGYSSDPVLSRYREHGFSGIITKPYRLQDLSDCLKSTLVQRSAVQPQTAAPPGITDFQKMP